MEKSFWLKKKKKKVGGRAAEKEDLIKNGACRIPKIGVGVILGRIDRNLWSGRRMHHSNVGN